MSIAEVYASGIDRIREINRSEAFDPFPLPELPGRRETTPSMDLGESGLKHARSREEAIDFASRVAGQVHEGQEQTNAFISFRSPEPEEQEGEGPLSGLTFAVKDNICVAGEATTCGSSLRDRTPVERASAPVVEQLREAGALYVGKTNMGELAVTFASPRFGDVRNPWDLDRSAGGSSSGSAAAVAANYVDFSLGTDSAGSVRIPAAMCGVVGFRPTNGSLPLGGIIGPAWSVDGYGLFARTVSDVATVMAPLQWNVWPRGVRKKWKLGVVADESMGRIENDVASVYQAALSRIEAAGIEVLPVSLVGLEIAQLACAGIAYSEVGWQHRESIRERWSEYGYESRRLIRLGQLFDVSDYLEMQRLRFLIGRKYAERAGGFDAILTPTLPIVAPPRGGEATVKHDDTDLALFTIVRFTALANFLALPSISVPAGRVPSGLPVGLQLMGRSCRDADLLAIAARVEDALAFQDRPSYPEWL